MQEGCLDNVRTSYNITKFKKDENTKTLTKLAVLLYHQQTLFGVGSMI